MDLIAQLAGTLGVDPNKAAALAGTVVGGAKDQLAAAGDSASAAKVGAAVPELGDWLSKAQALTGGGDAGGIGGMLGGMLGGSGAGAALGAVGGAAGVISKLSALGIDASMIAKAAPMVLQFLEGRVDADVLAKIKPVVAALSGGDAKGGGIGGALGGLGGLFG